MHKDFVTQTVVTKTDFIVTASRDGQLKFWKKLPELVTFAKKYKAHLGTLRVFRIPLSTLFSVCFWHRMLYVIPVCSLRV